MYFTSHHVVFSDGIDGEEDETGVKDKKIADTNTGTNWVLLPSSWFTSVSVHHGYIVLSYLLLVQNMLRILYFWLSVSVIQ